MRSDSRRWTPAVLAASLALGLATPGRPAPQASTATAVPPAVFMLPADSLMVMGADVRGFFASRLWSQISSGQLGLEVGITAEQAAKMSKEMQADLAKGMAEMEAEVGFRGDRDVDTVVLAMRNPDAPEPEIVGIVSGRFDRERILAAFTATSTKQGSKLSHKQVGSVAVHWDEKAAGKRGPAWALPSNGQLVFGELAMVEAVLQSIAAGRRPLEGNPELGTRLRGLKMRPGAFFLASEGLLKKMGESKSPPPFPLPKSFAMSMEFDGATELTAEMAAAAQAQETAQMLQAQLAMAGAALAQQPDAEKAGIGKVLAGVTVKAEGSTLRISGSPGTMGAGMLAAVAIPSLLRARVAANEAAAIGDLRTVVSAQMAYASANKDLYGEMACLSAPATCIKGYTGPQFVDAELSAMQPKTGYRRAFFPGKKGVRARSFAGFAFVAVPVEPGKTGVRSFCVDDSGVIRFDAKGGDIQPVAGACPPALPTLQ